MVVVLVIVFEMNSSLRRTVGIIVGTFQPWFISRVKQCSVFSSIRIISAMQCYLLNVNSFILRQISSVEFSNQAVALFSCSLNFLILTGHGTQTRYSASKRKLILEPENSRRYGETGETLVIEGEFYLRDCSV